MIGLTPVVLLVAAMVLLSGRDRGPPRRRLQELTGGAAHPVALGTGSTSTPAFRRALAAGAGGCLLLLVGGLGGILVGTAGAVAIDRLMARRPDPQDVRNAEAAARDLPLALDLLACALRAGQPPGTASAAVAAAIGGPVGAALASVARSTGLGSPADEAWQPLGRLPGAAAVARTLARADSSGSRLAEELTRTAADLRDRRGSATDARVRRAGVLVVLPLGLCFLPAFVCVGVVPIVIGIAGSVLR